MSRTIDKVAWIEVDNGRILSTRSHGRSRYYIPGGKREEGEQDLQTLVREIAEELTVDLLPETAAFFGEFQAQADGHPDGVVVRMRCYTCSYRGTPVAAAEIEEVVWLDYSHRHLVSPVDQIIFDQMRKDRML